MFYVANAKIAFPQNTFFFFKCLSVDGVIFRLFVVHFLHSHSCSRKVHCICSSTGPLVNGEKLGNCDAKDICDKKDRRGARKKD